MPALDMPLERLKTYMGTTPCPADLDEYWDRALAEMYAIDPQPVFTPYDLGSVCCDAFDMTFTSVAGARIHGRLLRPKHIADKVPAVIEFHGLGGYAQDWAEMLIYASQGYVSVSMDARGQGGSSDDPNGYAGTTYGEPFIRGIDGPAEKLYTRSLFLDTAMLARVVMALPYVDENRVGVFGNSQGGGLALACASLMPGIKLCATQNPYMCDYQRVWEMDLCQNAYNALRFHIRLHDPRGERLQEIFTKMGYIDLQHLTKRIRAKVLMATGLMDTTCPPSSQFAAYNKIVSEKEMLLYPGFGHEEFFHHKTVVFQFLCQL